MANGKEDVNSEQKSISSLRCDVKISQLSSSVSTKFDAHCTLQRDAKAEQTTKLQMLHNTTHL